MYICYMYNGKQKIEWKAESVLETYCETDMTAEILKSDMKPITGLDKTN